ncbi:MAG: F0F1 ATP synthase subunit epsilon [Rhodomicrobium sp.]|nr:F0F1 ATP synthase subunit epsilon [Rhodomicrobium sp.]
MAETFHFELVSPERQLISGDVAEAVIPGQEGDFAALPNHALLIAQLRPGILTTRSTGGEEKHFYLRGGFADVGPGETVVIAEYAVALEDFSSAMLADEIAQAQQTFDEAHDDESRLSAQDRLERLQSLQPRLAS